MKSLKDFLQEFNWEGYHILSEELLKFDDHSVDAELSHQASTYSFFHAVMCLAKKELSDAEAEHMQFMSRLRRDIKNDSSSKQTAKDLDDAVLSDDKNREHQNRVNELSFRYELLKGLVRALEQKKDMLQQVSANKREETKLYK